MLEFLDYISIFMILFNSIVIVASTRYYRKTKIPEYLLFSFAFFFSIYFSIYTSFLKLIYPDFFPLNQAIGTVLDNTPNISLRIIYFINGISVPGLLLFLGIYFLRANWVHPPKILWLFMIGGFLLNVLVYLPVLFNANLHMGLTKNRAILLRAWIWGIPALSYGLLCLRLYPKLQDPIYATERTTQAIKLWKFAYIVTFIWAAEAMVWRIYLTITLDFTSSVNEVFMNLGSFWGLLAFSITAYIAIKYPEAILIFHTQIFRAKYLYDLIIEKEKIQDPRPLNAIEDYLKNIPIELFQKVPSGTR